MTPSGPQRRHCEAVNDSHRTDRAALQGLAAPALAGKQSQAALIQSGAAVLSPVGPTEASGCEDDLLNRLLSGECPPLLLLMEGLRTAPSEEFTAPASFHSRPAGGKSHCSLVPTQELCCFSATVCVRLLGLCVCVCVCENEWSRRRRNLDVEVFSLCNFTLRAA